MYNDITAKLNFYVDAKVVSDIDAQEIYIKIKSIGLKISQLQSRVKKTTDIAECVEISVELNKLQKEKELLNSKI